ncbi:MAG: HNH endonuclease [Caulobacteraceae bacterium]
MPMKPPNQRAAQSKADRAKATVEHDQRRGSAASRGYGHRWRVARLEHLKQHPLCVMCLPRIAMSATVVDHIIPHRGDQALFWDRSNWQSLCGPHHDRDKQREEHAHG